MKHSATYVMAIRGRGISTSDSPHTLDSKRGDIYKQNNGFLVEFSVSQISVADPDPVKSGHLRPDSEHCSEAHLILKNTF
jgi:hypothetical protein